MKRLKYFQNQLVTLIVYLNFILIVTQATECPICGTSKIIKCIRLNKTFRDVNFLPDFKCVCKYSESDDNSCKNLNLKNKNSIQKSNETILDIEKFKPKDPLSIQSINNECLNVHVGMAIRGHNLLHRQWINKEHCFNLCLTTNIKNGHLFNCRSFEHWHRDCNPSNQHDQHDSICASFIENEENTDLHHAFHYHHNKKNRAVKLDICVLSNQTVKTSGDDFAPNNAVTYYELICNKPVVLIDSTRATKLTTTAIKQNVTQMVTSTQQVNITLTSVHVELSRKNKNHTKKFENSLPKEDLILASKKCKFNPCLNDGACLLIETERFTCLCKDFFYGVYCENRGIHKICHKTSMEVIINYNEIMEQLRIEMNDLYINEKTNGSTGPCKLKYLNETHARFLLPYDKCFTHITNMQFEKVYTNKLYSTMKIDSKFSNIKNESEKNYLIALECRLDRTTTYATHFSNEKNTNSTSPNSNFCLVDFLNLKLRVFLDEHYRDEMSTHLNGITSSNNSIIKLDQKMFARVSVEYSDKLNELYQYLDKYQIKLHLTLSYCWLTPTRNENSNIYQVLIENGCPKEKVRFHDKAISSLRFSFNFLETLNKESQFYLNCLPDLCTDSSTSIETNSNQKFKSCQNITSLCQNQYILSRYKIDQNQIKENIKSSLLASESNCNYKLTVGPIFFAENNGKKVSKELTSLDTKTNSAKSNSENYFIILYSLIVLMRP